MSVHTDSALDLENLIDLEDEPRCEWQDAETVHGEGEVATAMSHLPCSVCSGITHALIGESCIAMMHRVHREIPDLTYDCTICGAATKLSLAYITPI